MTAPPAAPHRVVIDVPGVRHGDLPIPMGARIGKLVVSSGIHGMDPDTGTIPDDPASQVALVFRHMRTIVENAGGSIGDIGFVLVRLRDPAHRDLVNAAWVEMFPDPEDRPARNVKVQELGWNMAIHLELTAVLP